MRTIFRIIRISFVLATFSVYAQHNAHDTISATEYHGLVVDRNKNAPLPYTNVYIQHHNRGTVSNEFGNFIIDISGLDHEDTVRFQFIGYKTQFISLQQLLVTDTVFMAEEIINLSETIVFGSIPDLISIVKNVLIYKDSNYRQSTSMKKAFIRERENVNIKEFKLNYKKSNIAQLDREMIDGIEKNFPRQTTSYTDLLGNLYFNKNKDDSVRFKFGPIKTVALEEKDIAEFEDQFETIFKDMISGTQEDEYWKVRSGVFGQKIELDEEDKEKITDTVNNFRNQTAFYAYNARSQYRYSNLNDKDQWEFLHKTGKYKYTLIGGTSVNGEEAYIIDFQPKSGGHYTGRMFIGMRSFALLRADYAYAPDKTGTDFQLLGVGYTEYQFKGSIYFERAGDHYKVKYFSYKYGSEASIDRSIILMKKRKRWLFDKTLNEFKVGIELFVDVEETVEFLALEHTELTQSQFNTFEQPELMEIIYVDQFDDDLWKGYSIIEPTRKMKEYHKLGSRDDQ